VLRPQPTKEKAIIEADFKYIFHESKLKIVKYLGNEKSLVLPDEIQSQPIRIIGAGAFANLSFLESVIIPESVVIINREAFFNCENLKEVVLPHKLKSINKSTFENCKSLISIRIPFYLQKICTKAFKGCASLKEIYYYNMMGLEPSEMCAEPSSKELDLPARIEYIGEYAFEGCESLTEVVIPWRVTILNDGIFKGCTSLSNVHNHDFLEEIRAESFASCSSLEELKLPFSTNQIANNAIPKNTTIICFENSYAANFALENSSSVRFVKKELPEVISDFIPSEKDIISLEDHIPFYTEVDLSEYKEKFEMRTPSYNVKRDLKHFKYKEIPPSRYKLKDGIFINKSSGDVDRAIIRMTGDLMCRRLQQKAAEGSNGSYDFRSSFHFVKDLLRAADFSIGNLETTISPSAPLAKEVSFMNNTTYFNAPEEYLFALKDASFDALNNAQNHIYDTGLRGIFETLDMQNKYQFMHLGASASEYDKRYLLIEVNGIKVAFLAYFDAAIHLMKRANFTKLGGEIMTSAFSRENGDSRVLEDVVNAKAEGAEFIVAFCHWGKEYTHKISNFQAEFASMVANAGVDYIFGSHPHCLQPYDVIITIDGREVPVFYSAGNFITDMNIKAPITRDSIIGELILKRNKAGKVVIESTGYYPCRIMDLSTDKFNYSVIPTEMDIIGELELNRNLKRAQRRIVNVIGDKARRLRMKNFDLTFISKRTLSNYADVKVTHERELFTVNELCDFINIEVPKKFTSQSDECVSNTLFFKELENYRELVSDIKVIDSFLEEDYTKLKKNSVNFLRRYKKFDVLEQNDEKILQAFIRWRYTFSIHGFSWENYFDYELYRKKVEEVQEFASEAYRWHVYNTCTIMDYKKYCDDKALFNITFAKYVKRDFLEIAKADFEDFVSFTDKYPTFFGKPNDFSGGWKASAITVDENKEALFKMLQDGEYIIEEVVKQHPEIAEFNPDTLNTMRICTLRTLNDDIIITYAGIRFGRAGGSVDNMSRGGMSTVIDINTGKITSSARNKYRDQYEEHPDSKKPFKGFQIPSWDKIIQAVTESALEMPYIRHVGWDLSITSRGEVEFIEGNRSPNFRIMQVADQVGKKYLYEKHIDELEASDWKNQLLV